MPLMAFKVLLLNSSDIFYFSKKNTVLSHYTTLKV